MSTLVLKDCTFEVATRCHDHLITTVSHLKDVPSEANHVLWKFRVVKEWLDLLEKCDMDLFDVRLREKSLGLIWRLWRDSRTSDLSDRYKI